MKGRLRPVDYIAWAQTVPVGARWDLTASGVRDRAGTPCADGWDAAWVPGDLARRDRAATIQSEFLAAVAARYGVDPECATATAGASGAIAQVLLALARPGDHVIVERPTYEPLHRVPELLGLSVSRLERKFEERWEPLADRLARLLTPKTRAVILSSLHNPSGVAIEAAALEAIGEMAARVGALGLVDEVYLDFRFDRGDALPWRPACRVIDNAVSWSSTTKAFGFSALRAGWAVTSDRALAQTIRGASHYLHMDLPSASLGLATAVLERADALVDVAHAEIAAARAVLDAWIEAEDRLRWVAPDGGQTCLVRLPDLTADVEFCRHLRERYDTQVVPGSLFEAPGFVRLSFNLAPTELEQALATISAALDDFGARKAGLG